MTNCTIHNPTNNCNVDYTQMPFPESKRVIYKKNPLHEVICQLRFPPVLRIESELPSQFQDKIRANYPLYQERPEPPRLPREILQQMPAEFIRTIETNKVYDFVSDDEKWIVTLSRDFIALTTREYERWEQFRERLEDAIKALLAIYSPAFFTRVGLRYQNIIRKSTLGFDPNTPWSKLLRPYIIGELSSPDTEIVNLIKEKVTQTLIQLPDGGQVRIEHGLIQVNENNETSYLIDSDFFSTERRETKDVLSILATYNVYNRQLFDWCITRELREVMEPQDPD